MEVPRPIPDKVAETLVTLDFWRAETVRRLLVIKHFATECDGNARPPTVAFRDGTNSRAWIWFALWLEDVRHYLKKLGYGEAVRSRLDRWISYEPGYLGQAGSAYMARQLENAHVAREEGRNWVVTPEKEGKLEVYGAELRAEIDKIVEELVDGRLK
jgi:hypothetical protein